MSIDRINPLLPGFSPVKPIKPLNQEQVAEKKAGTESFSQALAEALREIDRLQKEADGQIEDLILQKNGATTHSAMVALEKADTAFQLMNNIRTRIIRAYEDIMRTQV